MGGPAFQLGRVWIVKAHIKVEDREGGFEVFPLGGEGKGAGAGGDLPGDALGAENMFLQHGRDLAQILLRTRSQQEDSHTASSGVS